MIENLKFENAKLFNELSSREEDDKSSDSATVSTMSMKLINASKIKNEEVSAILSKQGIDLIELTSRDLQLKAVTAEREKFSKLNCLLDRFMIILRVGTQGQGRVRG